MIYETRIYETHPGKLPNLHDRFRNHTMRIFEKFGIKILDIGPQRLVNIAID